VPNKFDFLVKVSVVIKNQGLWGWWKKERREEEGGGETSGFK